VGKREKPRDPRVPLAPVLSVLTSMVTKGLCDEVFNDLRDKERQRKFSLHSLFWFWTSVVLRAPRSLSLAFEEAGLGVDPVVPQFDAALASFFDRCKSMSYGFFMGLYHRFVEGLMGRSSAPFASPLAHLKNRFTGIQIIDGSMCDRIAHRLKILHKVRAVVLPGCMTAVYDLFHGFATRLFFWGDAAMAEFKRAVEVIQTLPEGTLLGGKVRDLMANRGLSIGPRLGKRGMAVLALLRDVGDEVIHLVGGKKTAILPFVTELAPGIPPAGRFGVGPRSLPHVGRWWLVGVPGILSESFLEVVDPLLKSGDKCFQIRHSRRELCAVRASRTCRLRTLHSLHADIIGRKGHGLYWNFGRPAFFRSGDAGSCRGPWPRRADYTTLPICQRS
jgi:hypothetical protein